MQYRNLGRTGIKVSPYALGALMFATQVGNPDPEDSIRTSTKPASNLVEAHWVAERRGLERFRTEQPPYSILNRSIETSRWRSRSRTRVSRARCSVSAP